MKHPNMEMSDASQAGLKKRSSQTSMLDYKDTEKKDCSYYFLKLDFEILKPLLIYKYDAEQMNREDEYIEIIMSDANLLGSVYGKMDESMLKFDNQAEQDRIAIALSYVQETKNNGSYRMRNTAAGGLRGPRVSHVPYADRKLTQMGGRPMSQFGVGQSGLKMGQDLSESRNSNLSLGQTIKSHNFNRSMANKLGYNGREGASPQISTKRSMAG